MTTWSKLGHIDIWQGRARGKDGLSGARCNCFPIFLYATAKAKQRKILQTDELFSHAFDTKPTKCPAFVGLVIPRYRVRASPATGKSLEGIQGRQDWPWELLNLCSRGFNFLNVSTYRAGAREAKSGSCFSPCHC